MECIYRGPGRDDTSIDPPTNTTRERDWPRVAETLERLRQACDDGRSNTMPYILDPVNAYATLDEVMGVMRKVFGEDRERVV